MYRIDIGIDLGTSKVCVYMRDKGIVINQPSVIAFEKKEKKILAVGKKAKKMLGKTTDNIIVARPIKNGVISEYFLAERMIKAFVKNALRTRRILGRPNICVAVPQGITEVERRAVEDAIVKTGAKEVFLLESPIAAALGSGVDIMETKGHMVVDIGGGTTEIAVISLGGIVTSCSIRIGGDEMDSAIIQYIKRVYNLMIGERTAEEIKITIGSAIVNPNADKTMDIRGRDLVSGLPKNLTIRASEIRDALSEPVYKIIDAVKGTLEKTPPELAADVMDHGIMMTGGGALLSNLDKLLSNETGMPVLVSEDALSCVGEGTGRSLENIELLKRVVMTTKKLR